MSPLELFRRNQKVMMTGLILLAMFAFVVLPTVSEYLARSGPGMVDPVMAEFNGVSLTASRVNAFTRKHYETVQFLRRLAEETTKRGGTPQVPGYSVDPRTQMIQGIGINGAPSDDMSIRTLQFAAEAQESGFELDDLAVEFWLERFTDGTMSEREILALLRKESNNQMGQYQLYDMLRKQLLSGLYLRGAGATVARGQFPLQTPLDHWNNFLRLNQNAIINTYGVLVNDFVEQTDANPSEAEIVATYEAGKDLYPSEQSPEPGFRRRDTATVQYVVAELQAFRDAEVEKLSEDVIRAAYEKEIAGGAFQMPADISIESETQPGPDAATEDEAEMKPETDAPAASDPAAGDDQPSESEAGDEKEEMTDAADSDAADSDNADSDAAKRETEAAEKKQVADFEQELEAAGKLETPAEAPAADEADAPEEAESDADAPTEDQQSSLPSEAAAVRLVAMQSDVSTEGNGEEAGEPAEADDSDNAAESTEASTEPDAPANESTAAKTDEPTEQPRVRPFEEVRDQVALSLVEQDARVALDQAVTKVRSAMRKYSRQRSLHESGATEGPAPTPPNLEALADELGMSYRVIGPHDAVTMADEPIANSYEEGTALSQRGVPFSALVFGVEGQVVKQETYSPIVSVDLETQRTYVAWKTEDIEAFTPQLEDIRDEVVDAVRFAQARKLAEQAAQSIAEKANESGSLADLVPEDRKDNYQQDVGPFSWLQQVGFGVTIGEVPELDSVNEDFMKAVFTAKEGEYVVAPNGPERVYYVATRTSLQPATVDLRAIFKQPSQRMISTFISDGTATKVQQGYFDAVDEQSGFNQYEIEQ